MFKFFVQLMLVLIILGCAQVPQIKQITKEKATPLVEKYIQGMPQYKNSHGRNLSLIEIKDVNCSFCWSYKYVFDMDSPKNPGAVDLVMVTLTIRQAMILETVFLEWPKSEVTRCFAWHDTETCCTNYSVEKCPGECVICPPCAECSSISCHSEDFCKTFGFDRYWYSQTRPQEPICKDKCGDGVCDDVVCSGSGCPCAETPKSCPKDCGYQKSCTVDSDCACGVHIHTGECFYGNKKYVNELKQCPDFCNGIAANLKIICDRGQCSQFSRR